jgi:hypothetical protein
MPLESLAVGSYKCFSQTQRLELRPLTVLLGKNNSGKSTLARLPLVLATGLQTESEAPLELDLLGEEVAGSFTDLIYGRRPHGSVTFGLTYETSELGPVEITAEVQNIDEYQIQVVSRFRLAVAEQEFDLSWDVESDPRAKARSYISRGLRGSQPVPFRGLLPDLTSRVDQTGSPSEKIFSRALAIARREWVGVRYLGPFRVQPQRLYRLPTRAPKNVGTTGEDAPGIVADDLFRGTGTFLAQINGYLEENLPGWHFDVEMRENLYSIVLVSPDNPGLRVNLADTGTGIAQVLPILVQRAQDATNPPRETTIEIIEQPELHLHPAAHAAIADLYLAGLAAENCRFLIETHSETFILRLRRRIAEGGLDPAQVRIYFVEHEGSSATVRPIKIDALGNVADWPGGVFAEDFAEVRALVNAQTSRA